MSRYYSLSSAIMTTRKYMHLTRTARATAYRELSNLVEKQCLTPTADKGRSSAYVIDWSCEKHYPDASYLGEDS